MKRHALPSMPCHEGSLCSVPVRALKIADKVGVGTGSSEVLERRS